MFKPLPSDELLRLPGYVFLNLEGCYDEEEAEEIYEAARRRLQESGNAPRHLNILSPSMVDEENAESCDTRDVLTVDPYIPRPGLVEFIESTRDWSSAELDLQKYPAFIGYIFGCRRRGKALEMWKRLRTLSLFSGSWNTPPEGEESVACGQIRMTQESYPMLQNVTLQLKCCSVKGWELPWSQLTSLTLEMLVDSHSDYLDIISWCGNLRTFHLAMGEISNWDDGRGNSRMVTAPSLRFLSIDPGLSSLSEMATNFVDKLRLPSLKRLEIQDDSDHWSPVDDSFISTLHSCIQRSSCNVRHLSVDIKSMQMKKDTLRRLLKATPSLKSLRLSVDAPEVTSRFIMSLGLSKLAEAILVTAQRR
jgi:hypothetical protein